MDSHLRVDDAGLLYGVSSGSLGNPGTGTDNRSFREAVADRRRWTLECDLCNPAPGSDDVLNLVANNESRLDIESSGGNLGLPLTLEQLSAELDAKGTTPSKPTDRKDTERGDASRAIVPMLDVSDRITGSEDGKQRSKGSTEFSLSRQGFLLLTVNIAECYPRMLSYEWCRPVLSSPELVSDLMVVVPIPINGTSPKLLLPILVARCVKTPTGSSNPDPG
jgi:hypothetical protein